MLLTRHTTELTRLRGVGPRVAANLRRLGIACERDLLLHFPRAWLDRRSMEHFGDGGGERPVSVQAEVMEHDWRPLRGRGRLLRIMLHDGCDYARLICFNRPFLARALPVGSRLVVSGQFTRDRGVWQCANFEFDLLGDGLEHLSFGRLVPVYPLTEGLTQKTMRRLVWQLLSAERAFEEPLPGYIMKKRNLRPFGQALHSMHFPPTWEDLEQARLTLAYAEFFLFQAALAYRRTAAGKGGKPQRYQAADVQSALQESCGFAFTAGQSKALEQICADLERPQPMQRLLMGDVGCGKTVVAAAAALLAARSGVQTAVAAPTSVLARQLYGRFRAYLEPHGVSCRYLSGRLSRGERRAVVAAVGDGSCAVVVGTHALFSADVRFAGLGLVIVDEQHRFGVDHRRSLRDKGEQADYLAMSATPIPRSLAMSLYGDFDLTRIRELPAGRPSLTTHWCRGDAKPAYQALEEALARGEQAYIVFPLVEESEKSDLEAAENSYARMQDSPLAVHGVGLLHGRLNEELKTAVMERFRTGECGLLIATSVVEVGVDNPNATLMIVHEAQRFGLSQLHQMRGRVGRGSRASTCFLITTSTCSEECVARMEIMCDTRDGFRIAEQDLRLRGPGDFLGVDQSGLPRFTALNMQQDTALMERARRDALFIFARDSELQSPHNRVLRERFAALTEKGWYE